MSCVLTSKKFLSLYSHLELLQTAQNKDQNRHIHNFLTTFSFTILPLTENIGHRALVYIEEYSLARGLRAGDAIIAATAVENHMTLASGNGKHFKPINELKLKVFRP